MKPSLFIGSSSEQLKIADSIELNLSCDAEVTPWKHAFKPTKATFTELLDIKDRFDFAVIVLTPDDILVSRKQKFNSPRDNVLFELGLFLGSIGAERVFAVIDSQIDTKILSDFDGVNILRYNRNRSDGNLNSALSPICTQIRQQIEKIGAREKTIAKEEFLFPGNLVGVKYLFENMDMAENKLFEDLKNDTGPIRLFFHIASQNIGLSGTLFDIVDEIAQEGKVDLRILHASKDSPIFSVDRLKSLGKTPARVFANLDYVERSLKELEALAASTLRRRTHTFPFNWRIYGLSDKLYFMPYFSEKNATKKSPVLVFSKSQNSLYHTFTNWFDFVWNESAPQRVRLTDIITPATPAGTALFLKWEEFHVFGIPKRDIYEERGRIRFYGIGGKRHTADETFEECALREGNEETQNAVVKLISSQSTDYFRNDNAISKISIINEKITPRLILEKRKHTGLGSMKESDDSYFLVAYNGLLKKKPIPSNELGAILLLTDKALQKFSEYQTIPLEEVLKHGGEIILQENISIDMEKNLTPHGTASYLIRKI